MRGLAKQFAFVPEASARRQLSRIDEMLARMTDSDLVPWGEVVQGITGFAPHAKGAANDTQLVGEALRHDLRELSLRLSARAPESSSAASTIPALAQSWRVSERTIHRWRRLGLLCCMMRARGTGLTIGVRHRDADAFRTRLPHLVPASARTRLTAANRREIIRLSRVEGERRITVAARSIAARIGVGRESVRKILIEHSNQSGAVPRGRPRAKPIARTIALVHSSRGAGTSALSKRLSITTSSADRLSCTTRIRALRAMAAALLPANAERPASFAREDAREVILGQSSVRTGLMPFVSARPSDWIPPASGTVATARVASARVVACRFLLLSVQGRVAALPKWGASSRVLDELERDLRWAAALAGALLRDAMPAILARVGKRGEGSERVLAAAIEELLRLIAHAPIEQLAMGRVRVDQSIALAADAAFSSGTARSRRGATTGRPMRDPILEAMPWTRMLRALPRQVAKAGCGDAVAALWTRRLGLDGNAPLTLAELAAVEGVSVRTLSARLSRSLRAKKQVR